MTLLKQLRRRLRIFWILRAGMPPIDAWQLAGRIDEDRAHAFIEGAYL